MSGKQPRSRVTQSVPTTSTREQRDTLSKQGRLTISLEDWHTDVSDLVFSDVTVCEYEAAGAENPEMRSWMEIFSRNAGDDKKEGIGHIQLADTITGESYAQWRVETQMNIPQHTRQATGVVLELIAREPNELTSVAKIKAVVEVIKVKVEDCQTAVDLLNPANAPQSSMASSA